MGVLITVTFDLKQASPAIYPKVQFDLENIDFSKQVSGKK